MSALPLSPGSRVGSYEIVARIGAGGMGEVWRAIDPKLSREIAIKILPENVALDATRLQRFEQEARSASSLSHPNIVTIHEIGESDSGRYIAMELVQGQTLREMTGAGPLPMRKLLQIATQIADGLAAAHARGIVHRDLKPENVMVSNDGFAKILDFGLAKLTEPDLETDATAMKPGVKTSPGQVMGTVGYMSPEQVTAREVDFRSDQFSFGAMLYEMATGKRAFHRETPAQTMTSILEDDPTPVLELNAKVPPPFRWVIDRCLEKDPNHRYASTQDLARDLHTLRDHLSEASGSGVFAAELTAGKRVSRRMMLAAAVLAALVIGAIGYGIGNRGRAAQAGEGPQFVQVSFHPGRIQSAAFTPDGKSILVTSWQGSDVPQLYLTHLGSPESQLLGTAAGRICGISSTGEVALIRPGNVLARMPLGGGAPRDFAEQVVGADWAPAGGDLAIARQTTGAFTIEYPIGKVLYRAPSPLALPRVAPDGDSVAFWRLRDGRWELMVVDRAGTSRRIAGSWESAYGLDWAPDGESLIFSAQLKADQVLQRATLEGKVSILTMPGRSVILNDVASDGTLLVTQVSARSRLFHRPRKDAEAKEITWLDFGVPAAISADGSTLLFFEAGAAGGETVRTYLHHDDGSEPILLGEGLAHDLSPDGKWALATTETAPERLQILPTGAGQPEVLDLGTLTNFEWCGWFPDGKRILLSANESEGATQLRIYDRSSRKWRAIGPPGYSTNLSKQMSLDGREAIVWNGAENRYSIMSLETGAIRPMPPLGSNDEVIGWATGGRSIYVARRDRMLVEFARVDLETGVRSAMQTITLPFTPGTLGAAIVINPAGDAFAYAAFETTSDLFTLRLAASQNRN